MMSKAVYRVTDALVTGLILTMAALLIWYPHNRVILARGMAGYGLPTCQTPDTALVGGCRWVGPGEQGTWVNYATPGRV